MRNSFNSKTVLFALTASALVLGSATVTEAGRGGSASRIQNAANTGSVDAIIAEVERAERLVCGACVPVVMALLDDERYEVRQVAAWWFARRPAQKQELRDRSLADLLGNDSVRARNAADVLGTFEHPNAIDALTQAAQRNDFSAEARAHAVRAIGAIGHLSGNDGLTAAMRDGDAGVRYEAVNAWVRIRQQRTATPVIPLIADSDLNVRRKAAAVVGKVRAADARVALEAQLASDADPIVRRNAAWSLGRLGDAASRSVLQAAVEDASPLVRMTAKVALRKLR